jgi:hypothetical protein
MGYGLMTTKTIYYPNRTKKRYFSMCDAARIAREVVKDRGDTPEEVLACIAKGMGFTYISLSRLTEVEAGLITTKQLPLLVKTVIKGLEYLTNKFRLLKPFLAPLLVILKKIYDLVNKIDVAEPPQERVENVVGDKCRCKDFKKGV